MKALIRTIGLTTVMATSTVMAGPVDQANVNTFASGDAAVASEVNQNFTALINAIDDNASRIAALEQANAVDTANFPGSFAMVGTAAEAQASNNIGDLSVDILDGDLTFNADGTFSLSLQEHSISLDVDGNTGGVTTQNEGPLADSLSGTWTLGTGGALTITPSTGEPLTANVAAGGDVLIFDEQGGYQAIRIGVRTP